LRIVKNAPFRDGALPTIDTRLDGHLVCNPPSPPSATKIAPYGPWSPDVSREERIAQLRCLAGIVACHCRSDHPLIATLCNAELNGDALQYAFAMFERSLVLTRRRSLSTFASVTSGRRRR
jgi:hypothetical protein